MNIKHKSFYYFFVGVLGEVIFITFLNIAVYGLNYFNIPRTTSGMGGTLVLYILPVTTLFFKAMDHLLVFAGQQDSEYFVLFSLGTSMGGFFTIFMYLNFGLKNVLLLFLIFVLVIRSLNHFKIL